MIKFKLMKQEDNQRLVSAKELWYELGVRRDFTSWLKGRVNKYGFIENVDYIRTSLIHQNGGIKNTQGGDRKSVDFAITLDMAKELAMIENNERGRAVRKYFIQCEKKLRAQETRELNILEDKIKRLETTVKDYQKKELSRLTTINAADVRWGSCKTIEMLQAKLDEDMQMIQKIFERFSHNKAEMGLYVRQLKNYI